MAQGSYRRKNIGFGREGEDPAKDRAFRFLDELGRGNANDFVIALVNQYIDGQQGPTKVIGTECIMVNFHTGVGEEDVLPKSGVGRKKLHKAVPSDPKPDIPPEKDISIPVMEPKPLVGEGAEGGTDPVAPYENDSLTEAEQAELGQAFQFDEEETQFTF